MVEEYRNITTEEVFFIFKEEHRICSQFDPEADSSIVITMNTSVEEWRFSMDLLNWDKLSQYLNKEFEISPYTEEWKNALCPAKNKTIQDVCELISKYAKLEVVKPIKLLGKDCISASIFKLIKKNLTKRGVDTTNLRPSSKIEPILKSNFGEFIEQINKNFTGVIPDVKIGTTKLDKIYGYAWMLSIVTLNIAIFWNSIWYLPFASILLALILGYLNNREFYSNEGMMTIPEIETFRDLIEQIVKKEYATQH